MQFPVVIFCTGTHVTGISLHAKTGSFQFTLQSFYCGKNLVTAFSDDDRNDNNLCRGDRCRKYQSFVIPVHTNDCSNASLGDTVTGLRSKLLLTIHILIGDAKCPGEVISKMVDGSDLEGSSIRHYSIDRHGKVSSRELIPVRTLGDDDWNTEVTIKFLRESKFILNLLICFIPGCMHGVGLHERGDLTKPDQRARVLCLIPECVHNLIEFQRKIGMRPDPQRIHWINCCFRGWTECKFHIQRRKTSMGNPVHLILKTFDVFRLFHKLRLGNQEREQCLFMISV